MTMKELREIDPWEWPPETGKLIKDALRNRGSAGEREIAVELASENVVTDDIMAELLLSIVESAEEPEALRARSAIALGPVLATCDMEGFDPDDPLSEPPLRKETFDRIEAALRRMHEDETAPKELRRRALEAAVRAPQDWQPDAIRKAYASADPEWKLTAIFGMGHVPGFESEIVKEIGNKDPLLRREAIVAAGTAGVEKAWPQIQRILEKERKDKDLLIAAIGAAINVNEEESKGLLIDFTESSDAEIAEAAEEALSWGTGEGDEFDGEEEEEE